MADGRARLAVRWLHGPGGQGKSRLASQFAAESAQAGWKVAAAFQGRDADWPEPGSQDLRPEAAAGLLVIVDYADRWDLTNLTWLFKNTLLHRPGVATRVLMVARTADAWPQSAPSWTPTKHRHPPTSCPLWLGIGRADRHVHCRPRQLRRHLPASGCHRHIGAGDPGRHGVRADTRGADGRPGRRRRPHQRHQAAEGHGRADYVPAGPGTVALGPPIQRR